VTPPDRASFENAILRNLLAQTTSAYEEKVAALSHEKELAQVTLASIGDGVITTDQVGQVLYLNPVAEKLTGWQTDAAAGRGVEEVFRIVDEQSGAVFERLIDQVLRGEVFREPDGRRMLVRQDGQRFAVEHTAAPIRNADGRVIGVVIVFQDVTDQRLLALQLAHQASHDALTGLLNREAFDQALREALASSMETGEGHCLLYMDLDQFKLINDTCGHLAGDDLLCRVSVLISEGVREGDVVARLGGDEFGILLRGCDVKPALTISGRIHRAVESHRFTWRDQSFSVGASIGVVPIDGGSKNVTQLLSAADHACYAAKERGRGRIQVYERDDVELARRTDEMNWVLRIRQALEEGRFRLFAQKIRKVRDFSEPEPLFFEVLLRMTDEGGRTLAPSSFVRAAERYGVMREIDRWVLMRTLAHLQSLTASERERLGTCSINLSAVSVSDESFLRFACDELDRNGVDPSMLCFEITETAVVANLPQAQRLIRELTDQGCRFALDDFGSGMASYSKLKGLRVQFLKIDQAFVRDLAHNRLDRAMVESINQMAHVLGIRTVAEGVSSELLLDKLKVLGVDYAQGFWIDRPGPLEDLV